MAKTIYSKNNEIFLSLLKTLRTKSELTQKDVAVLLHKPQSYVSKYESGERRLDILELKQICKAIGTNLINFVNILEDLLNESK